MDKTCENYKDCGLPYCLCEKCPEYKRKMKPILFNTDMVKAIMDGRKTQTRRVIKPQPKCYGPNLAHKHEYGLTDVFLSAEKGYLQCRRCGHYPMYSIENSTIAHYWKPPYAVGYTLWVRETWCRDDITPEDIYYRADYTDIQAKELFSNNDLQWRPSIHMPREAARIFLKVTDVRVERLQDITLDGVEKEGIKLAFPMKKLIDSAHLKRFIELWDSTIDQKNHWMDYSWGANPWVWVIEFERVR